MATEKVLAIGATGIEEIEIETGSGSSVTADNICDLVIDSPDYLNTNNPIFSVPFAGFGNLLYTPVNTTGTTTYTQLGTNAAVAPSQSGAGAASTYNINNIAHTTGTTATGYARAERSALTTILPRAKSSFYSVIPADGIGARWAARVTAILNVASNATDTYLASVTLLGAGPGTNAAVSSGDAGFTLSYTHSVNSGNWVITYRNSGGTLSTVNTTIPPVFGATGTHLVAKVVKTGASTSTTIITIDGVVAATITDAAVNVVGVIFVRLTIASRIIKTVGTTARTMSVAAGAVARNYL